MGLLSLHDFTKSIKYHFVWCHFTFGINGKRGHGLLCTAMGSPFYWYKNKYQTSFCMMSLWLCCYNVGMPMKIGKYSEHADERPFFQKMEKLLIQLLIYTTSRQWSQCNIKVIVHVCRTVSGNLFGTYAYVQGKFHESNMMKYPAKHVFTLLPSWICKDLNSLLKNVIRLMFTQTGIPPSPALFNVRDKVKISNFMFSHCHRPWRMS